MHPDALLERIKLKSQLKRWRIGAFLFLALLLLVLLGDSISPATPHANHIARVEITGMITEDPYRDSVIRGLAEKESVKGVVLYVNSPGGTAAGGESLYEALRILADTKPTVAMMGSLATSAGYLTTLSANHIIAHKGSLTGSIGVLFQAPNIEKLTDKIGIEMQTVKTDPLKGEPTPFKPMDPETRAMLKGLIDDFHNVFTGIVAERRGLSPEALRDVADGTVYSGNQALEKGLIDQLGTEHDARRWLEEAHGLSEKLPILKVDLTEPQHPFAALMHSWLDPNSLILNDFRYNGLLSVWEKAVIF